MPQNGHILIAARESVKAQAGTPAVLRTFPSAIFSRIRWEIREQTQRDPCPPLTW